MLHHRRLLSDDRGLNMRTQVVLDAIEMARFSRGTRLTGLRCHSDAGSQFTSVRYGERLRFVDRDRFLRNALAESVNGYYKYELIYGASWSIAASTFGRGCTGTITGGCMVTAATSRQQSTRRRSTTEQGEQTLVEIK